MTARQMLGVGLLGLGLSIPAQASKYDEDLAPVSERAAVVQAKSADAPAHPKKKKKSKGPSWLSGDSERADASRGE